MKIDPQNQLLAAQLLGSRPAAKASTPPPGAFSQALDGRAGVQARGTDQASPDRTPRTATTTAKAAEPAEARTSDPVPAKPPARERVATPGPAARPGAYLDIRV